MTIGGQEREILDSWAAEQRLQLDLELTDTRQSASGTLKAFCEQLTKACDMVQVSETIAPGEAQPALGLRNGAILYRAVPRGTELEPFLEALAAEGDTGKNRFRPAALQLFVAAACPHCPAAVRSLTPLAVAGGPLTLEIIDSEACSDLAEANGIKSVPTLILDRTFRWTGSIPSGDLAALLAPGHRADQDAGVLGRLLEAGNAAPLAELMVEAGQAAPALCRLLASEAMSTRLGAMMVIENLLERGPALVEPLIPLLQQEFAAAPEPARGDMLYIFGEAGSPSMTGKIESILEAGLHPEVEEAAREALERLAERHQ